MNINATIIGQMVTFVVFVWFCMKFIWPPLIEVLAERAKKITDGLGAAERAKNDLNLAQEKATNQLKEAKQQGAEVIEQAHQRGSKIIDEAKDQAQEEANRILKAAQAEVEQQFSRAKEELRAMVGQVAIAGAEKLLETSVDAKKHGDLLDKLAAEL